MGAHDGGEQVVPRESEVTLFFFRAAGFLVIILSLPAKYLKAQK